MGEGKHTPGPWLLHKEGGYFVNHGERYVAFAYVADNDHWKPSDEEQANARLIAAAPDLLRAAIMQDEAEIANANCDECSGEDDWSHCSKCSILFGDAIDARRAAIAKAQPHG